MNKTVIILLLFGLLVSCQEPEVEVPEIETLFRKISSEKSGVHFSNVVKDDPEYNYLTYEGFYQGGGVGLGDFNNDGLLDVFFAGNQNSDKLYINKGDFKFQDITKISGIIEDDSWSTGVAIADVNNDGLLDIYVSKFFYEDPHKRKNHLYINYGNNTFKEAADKFGLGDVGYAIQANFFDYDKDGDLDVYIVNQPPTKNALRYSIGSKIDYKYTDKLYKNNGEYGFEDVTQQAGLLNFGYGLNVLASDLTHDGWPDLYVSNDFEEADFFYQNNQNGTFSLVTKDVLGHISTYSMGSDAADVNNDGYLDFLVADMVAIDPYRQKTNMASMDAGKFNRLSKTYGLPQYMYNALQMSDGMGKFSEQGQLRGLAYSDWSWSVLMADFDNDMDKDVLITNGIQNDVTNKDVLNNMSAIRSKFYAAENKYKKEGIMSANELVLNEMPSAKLQNHLYSNDGYGFFERSNDQFGLKELTWTHGAAYGDLDNDGDLDLILNNSSGKSGIYENHSTNNFIRINLSQNDYKKCPIGSRVLAYTEDVVQMVELNPIRGYQSTCECTVHFGLKTHEMVDSLIIVWPDLSKRKLGKLPGNKTYYIQKRNAKQKFDFLNQSEKIRIVDSLQLPKVRIDDYQIQRLLPYEISSLGPIVTSNIEGNLIFVPGSKNISSAVYNFKNGRISKSPFQSFEKHKSTLDVAGHFIDIDNDGDQDLIVVTGGFSIGEQQSDYYDRLYINEGGNFRYSDKLPKVNQSGLAITSYDIDNNSFEDIVIGGRVVPGKYGDDPMTYVYYNMGDLNFKLDSFEQELGMITALEFEDLNKDGEKELLCSSEWGKVRIFKYQDGFFQDQTGVFNLSTDNGLWRNIFVDDFNNDGYKDLFCGNLGHNTKFVANEDEKLYLSHGDFDSNGTYDMYLTYDFEGDEIPIRGRQCSAEQMPNIKKKWQDYNSFALSNASDIIGEVSSQNKLSCTSLGNALFLGGKAGFDQVELSKEFQVSCINDLVKFDSDNWMVIGNYFEMEAETPRLDQLNVCGFRYENEKLNLVQYSNNNELRNTRSIRKIGNWFLLSTRSAVYILEKIKSS